MNCEIEVCRLCGTPDQDKQSDHIRECYKIAQDKLSRGQFHPRLESYEMDRLQRGSNPICSNISKCRDRRQKD